ncbi:hypothetical protein AN959_17660 [Psychrobacillus sp. FJAT-21963]|nr:hypothetical protein AN959_17660 [Psychrobacillus sp. FJAT-21963]
MVNVLVSINCTTYNHEKYIADAIESFLMQVTDFNYEILIGEDCSTDNTKQIVEEYARLYPEKIRLITSSHNVGARLNSQRLINQSRGKYIAECEGDDYWIDPYKLQEQVDYMESHQECSICFHAAKIIQAPKKPTGMKIRPYTINKICPIEDFISGGGFCPTGSLLYRKKLMEDPPDFYMRAHVGDYPMQLILASKGYAYYMDKYMAVYRIGVKGSWSSRKSKGENYKGKMININGGDIALLKDFNNFTRFKYEKAIENTILKKEFEIQLLKGNINAIKNSKYKMYIDGLSMKQKLKIYARCFFPNIYVSLARLKPYIYRVLLFLNMKERQKNGTK